MTHIPMKVAVAEDEPLTRKRLVRMLHGAGCIVVAEFSEGLSLQGWLNHHPVLDGLFLDLRMPDLDGTAIMKHLRGRIPVVVTTAHAEHAVAAFDNAVVDYLLKPFRTSRLRDALHRLESRRNPEASTPQQALLAGPIRFRVRAGNGFVLVDLARTTHFEVVNEEVWAHAQGRMKTFWTALNEVEEGLPAAGLLRVNRSVLIRPEAIVGVRPISGNRFAVRLAGGAEIEASRGGTLRLKECLGL
nr:LytTR family DNA-binding domain-containing protein [uncultured Holophaga sp.]